MIKPKIDVAKVVAGIKDNLKALKGIKRHKNQRI